MEGGLPAWLDDGCCDSLLGFPDVPSTSVRSISIYVDLSGAKKFFRWYFPCG
jgi:hypothetical protein